MSRVLAVALLLLAGQPASAETLGEAIADAWRTNPALAEARERQQALEQTPDEARAAGRLTAALDANGGYDHVDYGKGGSGTLSAGLPIWTGGRVSSAVRVAQGHVAAGAEGLRDNEAAVLEAVVGAYADVLYSQQAVAVAGADITLLDAQVREAQARFERGQATRTDVAQLQAQQAGAQATLAQAQATLAGVVASYRALVGHDPGVLVAALPMPGALPATAHEARAQAQQTNPLVRQQQWIAQADAAGIDQQKAERLPSLTLGGTYGYEAGSLRSGALTAGFGGVTLHVPLLTGGLVGAKVREAEATHRADLYATAAAAREAERAADTAWANLAAARSRILANQARVDAADLALRGVRAEYGFSLRSTLDILIADEALRGAQLALAQSRADVLTAHAALLRAVGRLDAASF
jgi:outer membrane protein